MNLKTLVSLSLNVIVRLKRCCKSKRTKPTPNSIAEKIKKKKVKESILRLSKINPIYNTITYNVIHKSSAVNNKCNAEFTPINIVEINMKKKRKKIFKSPKNKIIYLNITLFF